MEDNSLDYEYFLERIFPDVHHGIFHGKCEEYRSIARSYNVKGKFSPEYAYALGVVCGKIQDAISELLYVVDNSQNLYYILVDTQDELSTMLEDKDNLPDIYKVQEVLEKLFESVLQNYRNEN